jgi:hypothetical protein
MKKGAFADRTNRGPVAARPKATVRCVLFYGWGCFLVCGRGLLAEGVLFVFKHSHPLVFSVQGARSRRRHTRASAAVEEQSSAADVGIELSDMRERRSAAASSAAASVSSAAASTTAVGSGDSVTGATKRTRKRKAKAGTTGECEAQTKKPRGRRAGASAVDATRTVADASAGE